uniref:uncharacterized protein LOC123455361 n=1 Tax=Jaculus jaculus TaxID=51337 RepID=UPI001E1B1312|nr:uncharacterized protein LOC123455361 [Jaculus jaculus]
MALTTQVAVLEITYNENFFLTIFHLQFVESADEEPEAMEAEVVVCQCPREASACSSMAGLMYTFVLEENLGQNGGSTPGAAAGAVQQTLPTGPTASLQPGPPRSCLPCRCPGSFAVCRRFRLHVVSTWTRLQRSARTEHTRAPESPGHLGLSGWSGPEAHVSGLGSSLDRSPSLVTRKPPWRKPTKHSTPDEMTRGPSPRPPGRAAYLHGSPLPAHSSQDLASQLAEVSPIATFRKRRLSTVWDSEGSSAKLEPCADRSAAGEDPPASAPLNHPRKQPQRPPPRPPQAVRPPRSRQQNPGLPGIPDAAQRKRPDWKGRAAAMRRLKQWEARLLREIEEAIQHELTIQAEGALSAELTCQAEGAPTPQESHG